MVGASTPATSTSLTQSRDIGAALPTSTLVGAGACRQSTAHVASQVAAVATRCTSTKGYVEAPSRANVSSNTFAPESLFYIDI